MWSLYGYWVIVQTKWNMVILYACMYRCHHDSSVVDLVHVKFVFSRKLQITKPSVFAVILRGIVRDWPNFIQLFETLMFSDPKHMIYWIFVEKELFWHCYNHYRIRRCIYHVVIRTSLHKAVLVNKWPTWLAVKASYK